MWEFKDIPEGRFSLWQWCAHYLGISRIVYDPVWEEWKIRANPYNPLLWLCLLVLMLVLPFFTRESIGDTMGEVRDILRGEDDFLWDLYDSDECGVPKYMSYSEVMRHE
jgi:hypothetical protein